MTTLLLLLGLLASFLHTTESQIGVCYGLDGNNLPAPAQVISLYKSHKIGYMRLYGPNDTVLQALSGSNIEVMIGVPNYELQAMATNPGKAFTWVGRYILRFPNVKFRYIAVGNDIFRTGIARFVHPALINIYQAVSSYGLLGQIRVSTAVDTTLIGASFPPSEGAFRDDVRFYIDPIIKFLKAVHSPLLVNVYPYLSYLEKPTSIQYAVFTSPYVVVQDGVNGYQNLFDAMVDTMYSALERAGGSSLEIVISETGWPSAGAFGATFDNAQTFYTNMVAHASRGTPKRPGRVMETYLFAMFDENNLEPEVEKNFGVFYPNQQAKYNLTFN